MMDSGESIFSRDITRYITAMKKEADILIVGSKFQIEQENFMEFAGCFYIELYLVSKSRSDPRD